ncbi:MAG: O-antigen ligase family protein [Phycisphaeraceae bacterium]|nr:O-antigen ligase family protein [Phycisphaeraceae bacterium]
MHEEQFYMKHFIFLAGATLLGGLGAVYHPFWGILLYYSLAVLRPQYLWEWALPVQLRWSLYAAVIVLVSVVINTGRGFFRLRFTLVPALVILFAFCLIGSIINAYSPETAQHWGMEYLKILAAGLIMSVVVDRLWQVRALLAMVVLMMGYIAWEINYLYFFDGRLDIFHKGYGGLDNNGAGLMLAMALPLAYGMAMASRSRWLSYFWWGVAILTLHAMLMSYSRGAMISAGVGLIWILLHHKPRRYAVVILVASVFVISMLAGKEIRDRFRTTGDFEYDSSAQSRLDSWAAGWEIASEHPLTGTGIRNSKFFSNNYGADRMGRTIHSQYIQIAADCGIPAMVIYVSILGVCFWNSRLTRKLCGQYIKDHQRDHPEREPDRITREFIPLSLACEASLVIFAVGAAFLSVEVVELPWMLIIVVGILPQITEDHLLALKHAQVRPESPLPMPTLVPTSPARKPKRPMPSIRRGLTTP